MRPTYKDSGSLPDAIGGRRSSTARSRCLRGPLALRLLIAAVLGAWTMPGHTADLADAPRAPSIRSPGPDFADFPNGAEVVPPGQTYVELAPTYQRARQPSSRTASLDFLLRFGVARDLELRIYGNAVTDIETDSASQPASPADASRATGHRPGGLPRPPATQDAVGLGPIGIGIKSHLRSGGSDWRRPAVGFGFQVLLPVASTPALASDKALPSGSLNVEHTLSDAFSFNWNLGLQTALDQDNDMFLQATFAWSIEKNVTRDFQLYVTGVSTYPAASSGRQALHQVGGGFMVVLDEHAAVYLLAAPEYRSGSGRVGAMTQVGVSFAF